MADINARTRLLQGTTAQWAANNLVLGNGELVVELAPAVKMKLGNGTSTFSATAYLPFVTKAETDSYYLQLTGINIAPTANAVPRMGAGGQLPVAMLPNVSVSAGVPDAGKLPVLNGAGKIDASMLTAGAYKGTANVTAALPAGTYVSGDYFLNTGSGAAHATWTGLAGGAVVPGQTVIYSGSAWALSGTSTAYLPLAGGILTGALQLAAGTASLPSLTFASDAGLNTGLFWNAENEIGFAASNVGVWYMSTNNFSNQPLTNAPSFGGSTTTLSVFGGNSLASTSMGIARSSANGSGPILYLGKARDAVGVYTTPLAANDILGDVRFSGADGTNMRLSAYIRASATETFGGTVGAITVGSKLVFATGTPGSTTGGVASRLDLDSNGAWFHGATQGRLGVVDGGLSGALANSNCDGIVLDSDVQTGLTFLSPIGGNASINWGRPGGGTNNVAGRVTYEHALDRMNLVAGGVSVFQGTPAGAVLPAPTTISAALTLAGSVTSSADNNRFGGATVGHFGICKGTPSGIVPTTAGDTLVLDGSAGVGLSMLTSGASSSIYFGNTTTAIDGRIIYTNATRSMALYAGSSLGLTITGTELQANNLVRLPDGTLAATAIGFTSSAGTGLYAPAVGEWALAQAGVNRVRANSASQVCIQLAGTTPLAANLATSEIAFTRSTDTVLRVSMKGSDGTVRSATLTLA